MAFSKRAYPKDWPQIRKRLLERGGNRCEGSPRYPDCRAENGQPHPVTGSRVVLTCAHWPDPTKANVAEDNIHLWCMRCHLAMDRPYHMAVQRRNRELKRQRLQPTLPLEEER